MQFSQLTWSVGWGWQAYQTPEHLVWIFYSYADYRHIRVVFDQLLKKLDVALKKSHYTWLHDGLLEVKYNNSILRVLYGDRVKFTIIKGRDL